MPFEHKPCLIIGYKSQGTFYAPKNIRFTYQGVLYIHAFACMYAGDGTWNAPCLAVSSLITLWLYSPLLATGSFIRHHLKRNQFISKQMFQVPFHRCI